MSRNFSQIVREKKVILRLITCNMYLCLFSVENVANIITCLLFNRFKKRSVDLVRSCYSIDKIRKTLNEPLNIVCQNLNNQ